MKRSILFCMMCLMALVMQAQPLKVAILEPVDKAQNVSYAVKLLLRSSLTTAISNTLGYEGFDRVNLSSITDEQNFQRTGNVSDDQIKQLGIATGAAYVLVTEAAKYDEQSIIITANILDVETFGIKKSAVQVSGIKAEELSKACNSLASVLLGIEQTVQNAPNPQKETVTQQPTITGGIPDANEAKLLVALPDGTLVYVALEDEKGFYVFSQAEFVCSCKGSGWRLPTENELSIIYANNENYNLKKRIHWLRDGGAFNGIRTIHNEKVKERKPLYVRCVKEVKQ